MNGDPLKGLNYLISRYVLRRPYLSAVIPEFGFRMTFKTEDAAGRRMYRRGNYEPHLTKFVTEHVKLREGDVAFDIGANLGWFSLLLNSTTGGFVHAFEPDPLNFDLLSKNIAQNGAERILPVRSAVADQIGEMTLYLYPDKNRGRHSLLPINEGEKVSVQTITLDQYAEDSNIDPKTVRFIKIDIEGFETVALKGARKVLESGPMVLAEFVPEYMEKGGLSVSEYLDYMHSFGFEPHVVDVGSGAPRSVDLDFLKTHRAPLDLAWIRGRMPS